MNVAEAIDPAAVFVLALLVATLLLFQRWQESGDRSAYAIGALTAVAAPALATLHLVSWYIEAPFLGEGWRVQATGWGVLFFALPFLFFAWRPALATGFFAIASQTRIRRIYHSMETSWQYALSTLVAGQIAFVVWRWVETMAWA